MPHLPTHSSLFVNHLRNGHPSYIGRGSLFYFNMQSFKSQKLPLSSQRIHLEISLWEPNVPRASGRYFSMALNAESTNTSSGFCFFNSLKNLLPDESLSKYRIELSSIILSASLQETPLLTRCLSSLLANLAKWTEWIFPSSLLIIFHLTPQAIQHFTNSVGCILILSRKFEHTIYRT